MASKQQMNDIYNFEEFRNKCIGQDKCEDCPRYLDDCDGVDEDIEAKADLKRKELGDEDE